MRPIFGAWRWRPRGSRDLTALTIVGVVVGTFTLVVSLSVDQSVEWAIVAHFHEDDRLRKVLVHTKYQPIAQDIPESEREPRVPTSEAKRYWIRRELVGIGEGCFTGIDASVWMPRSPSCRSIEPLSNKMLCPPFLFIRLLAGDFRLMTTG